MREYNTLIMVLAGVIVFIGIGLLGYSIFLGNYSKGQPPLLNNSMKNYCTQESRGEVACTLEYLPVCGWFDESIQCIKYPCANTYGNKCSACADENVEYWTSGECPI